MEKNKDAEKDIINAARKVFYEKGFIKATMRDIAAAANTNLAMVNYYFRTKENLFNLIYDETFMALMNKLTKCLKEDNVSIENKIRNIISEYVEFFVENPYIPSFILGEIIRNPQEIAERMKTNLSQVSMRREFEEQIQKEINEGKLKPVSAYSVFTNILSLTIFPIISQPIIQEVFNFNPDQFNQFIDNRKEEISTMIINSIKA